jgi:hypothetical protein
MVPSQDPLATRRAPLSLLRSLYLSCLLSSALFLYAQWEGGHASLGINLYTPLFIIVHHIYVLVTYYRRNHRGRSAALKLGNEHKPIVITLAVLVSAATFFTLAVTRASWGELAVLRCTVPIVMCDDPRAIIKVVFQDIFGLGEAFVLWRMLLNLDAKSDFSELGDVEMGYGKDSRAVLSEDTTVLEVR